MDGPRFFGGLLFVLIGLILFSLGAEAIGAPIGIIALCIPGVSIKTIWR